MDICVFMDLSVCARVRVRVLKISQIGVMESRPGLVANTGISPKGPFADFRCIPAEKNTNLSAK